MPWTLSRASVFLVDVMTPCLPRQETSKRGLSQAHSKKVIPVISCSTSNSTEQSHFSSESSQVNRRIPQSEEEPIGLYQISHCLSSFDSPLFRPKTSVIKRKYFTKFKGRYTSTTGSCCQAQFSLRHSSLVILVLLLICNSVMSKPWFERKLDKVIVRGIICRPPTNDDLRQRMGADFDETRMATNKEEAKRLGDSLHDPSFPASGYQGDDPRVEEVNDERDFTSNPLWEEEEEEEEEEDLYEEEEVLDNDNDNNDDLKENLLTWSSREKIIKKKSLFGSRRWIKTGSREKLSSATDLSSDSLSFMRRKRSLRSGRRHFENTDIDRSLREKTNNDKPYYSMDKIINPNKKLKVKRKSNKETNILPLRLALSGNNKKLRRQLKKKFRQKMKNLDRVPPWTCNMNKTISFLGSEFFPSTITDGKCTTDKCFYRLYNCQPQKYAIKVLKRDNVNCNPLPVVGNTTIYEEKWDVVTYAVTVGCNCESLSYGKKSKTRNSRRRNY